MSVPTQRHTRSKVGKRRSHDALKKIKLSNCPKCKEPVLPHTACKNCGTYKGRQVLKIKTKETKKDKKQTTK